MSRRLLGAPFLVAALGALSLVSCGKETITQPPVTDRSLPAVLRHMRSEYGLPAMAGIVVRADTVSETDAVGLRRLGAPDSVRLTDHFHIGSNVKAMTADLVAMEVDAGRLHWDDTLAGLFPEWADSMRSEYKTVTLEALLQHRSGLPAFTTMAEWLTLPTFTGSATEQRAAYAHWILRQTPGTGVGNYLYSNAGYGLAAAILERSAGDAWESLIQARLWTPLGIAGGFGWPAAGGAPQPWGHMEQGFGNLVPHDPDDPAYQFPVCMRPAGDAWMSVGDYMKFAVLHLRALRGDPQLLSAASFQKLHAANGAYAMGWGVQSNVVSAQPTWFHVGSAGTFAVCVMLQPDRDMAVVAASNAGNQPALYAVQTAPITIMQP